MQVFLFFLLITTVQSFFPHFPFSIPEMGERILSTLKPRKCIGSFQIETREIKSILNPSTDPLFNQIKGFYGIIGPDINISSVSSLYDLFTGDGMIQGVFFKGGKMTFVKHFVRTDKLLYESIYGRFSKNLFMTPLYILLNKMGCLPNTMGLANTAFLKTPKETFALFERDHPYQINIDVENHNLHTVKKRTIPDLTHFSGHSKYKNQKIHTIDYDVLTNQLTYIQLTPQFNILFKTVIKTHYVPLIHDFVLSGNNMIFVDSPFVWMFSMDTKNPPVRFDRTQPTYIYLYDNVKHTTKFWMSPLSFYVFHYGHVEIGENIDIYAPVYDDIDFSSLHIKGRYRHISLRPSGEVVIKKNWALENLNLDFPLKWRRYVILREIENHVIKGFVVCKGLAIIKRIRLPEDRVFCGEPSIIELLGEPYLLGLSYDKYEMGYISLISVFKDDYREIELKERVSIGFHSIFMTPDE